MAEWLNGIFTIAVLLGIGMQDMHTEAVSNEDYKNLISAASMLQIPIGFWNFSTDPCTGKWTGVGCCSNNSRASCCQFPLKSYPPLLPCDVSADAQITTLLLRSDVVGQNLNGTIPESLCEISSLTILDVGLNHLSGQIPSCIGNLSSLKILRLGGNSLNGTIPPELGNLNQLQELYLDSSSISGSIPSSLGRLSDLQTLVLRSNALVGNIPEEIGQLINLKDLQLQVNKLTGVIPTAFVNLAGLNTLMLFNNELSGELNASIFQNMIMLKTLSLRNNHLTGALPTVVQLSLIKLDLGFNQFTGQIPESSMSPSLQEIFLGHNRLNGSIPAIFSSLALLSYLDISHNSLVGQLDNLVSTGNRNALITPQIDFAFNILNVSSTAATFFGASQQSFFNCFATTCLQSSPTQSIGFSVNAGGPTLRNSDGITFDSDMNVGSNQTLGLYYGQNSWALEISGTSGGSYSSSVPIITNLSGESPDLYKNMRWSSSYIAYHGFGLRTGNYTVNIYIAEIVFTEPGYRIFNVLVQGQVVKQNLDVVKEVGPNAAYKISLNMSIVDGRISIEFIYTGRDRYLIPGKWAVESIGPMVSAISIVSLDYIREAKPSFSSAKVAAVVVGSIMGVAAFIIFIILRCKKRRSTQLDDQHGSSESLRLDQQRDDLEAIRLFKYDELQKATNGFSCKLGEGGFGAVFKGTLPNGVEIAVKQLLVNQNREIKADFKKEVSIISNVRHKNLVAICGYSVDRDVLMLVCEYVSNGNLDKWLRKGILSWELRRHIAIGVACGLAYLHEESEYRIIHCDVKPANILLDADFNPLIADFGLSLLYDETQSHITASRLKGTAGYLAPEYAMHLQVSDKVDVYGFGVVLLQLLSGMGSVDFSRPTEQIVLVDWAHQQVQSNILSILDEKLAGQYVEEEAKDMASIAILCTQTSPSLRPKMQSVWLMLKGAIKVPDFLESLKIAGLEQSDSFGVDAYPPLEQSDSFGVDAYPPGNIKYEWM